MLGHVLSERRHARRALAEIHRAAPTVGADETLRDFLRLLVGAGFALLIALLIDALGFLMRFLLCRIAPLAFQIVLFIDALRLVPILLLRRRPSLTFQVVLPIDSVGFRPLTCQFRVSRRRLLLTYCVILFVDSLGFVPVLLILRGTLLTRHIVLLVDAFRFGTVFFILSAASRVALLLYGVVLLIDTVGFRALPPIRFEPLLAGKIVLSVDAVGFGALTGEFGIACRFRLLASLLVLLIDAFRLCSLASFGFRLLLSRQFVLAVDALGFRFLACLFSAAGGFLLLAHLGEAFVGTAGLFFLSSAGFFHSLTGFFGAAGGFLSRFLRAVALLCLRQGSVSACEQQGEKKKGERFFHRVDLLRIGRKWVTGRVQVLSIEKAKWWSILRWSEKTHKKTSCKKEKSEIDIPRQIGYTA